jgi:hypothetical protein
MTGLQYAFIHSITVVLKLFWFAAHCKTFKYFLEHLVYKIKNILMYFKLWSKIKLMDVINLYTNGFIHILKIYIHNIRATPSRLLRRTVWESLLYKLLCIYEVWRERGARKYSKSVGESEKYREKWGTLYYTGRKIIILLRRFQASSARPF